jgi:chondroitin-sulfate-ABC endolyase/exolyase
MVVLLACVLPLCAAAWGQDTGYESFEDGVPAYFIATRAESMSLSPWHAKQGKNSLRWDWRQGEEIVIRHGIGDVNRRGGLGKGARACFAVWVYMEQPQAGALVFEFREGTKVTGSFRFPLEFTGWRQGRPAYPYFPSGKPTSRVDNIRIAAPTTAAKGTVFLDLIKYNTLGGGILPEQEAQWRPPAPDERRLPKPDRVTAAELAGIRQLQGPNMGPGVGDGTVKNLCSQVKALGIVRDAHGVRGGPGIDNGFQYVHEVGELGSKGPGRWCDEHGPGYLGMQGAESMTYLGYQVAQAYRASRDPQQRRQLADVFLSVEDHLYDQGMQAAAGFRWNWYAGGAWADAVFFMRDVLADAGRLARQRDYYLWNWGGAELFAESDPPSYMDYYLQNVPCLLRACLLQVEPPEQVRWLRAYKTMIERSILQPASVFKIDGCAFHHGGHYFGYAGPTMPVLTETLRSLSSTPWRLGAEAHERVRRAALAQRIFCNQRDLPLSLSGRSPFREDNSHLRPEGLDNLARSGSPDGREAIDPLSAAAYLRLVPEAAQKEPYRSLGLKPEPEPNGCFVMPYSALLNYRHDNWLASLHGQSKYVWGTERQSKENCFGLFEALGSLEILAGGNPVTAPASGRQAAGWDWRRFEGTTAPQLPLSSIDKIWERDSNPFTPEPFVGGLSHQGRQGIFAMIVNQRLTGTKTLKARKSWFFSGDRILCLASDISCDEAEYPTQTTLCQRALLKDKQGKFLLTRLDGSKFTALTQERSLDEARPHWFLDVQQTGYFLPAGQKATVARRHQKSRDRLDLADTEGDFLTAWIDHGKAPAAAKYAYVLVVRATAEAMQRLAAKPPYRVLQRDQAAHIVWDIADRRWGCVFFIPQEVATQAVAAETLPVKAVDRPCLVMADAVREGHLDLTVADPDLNLGKPVGSGGGISLGPLSLHVTLHGTWRLLETTGTVCAWHLPSASESVRILSTNETETVLGIPCQHGASYELKLARQ